MKLLGQKITRVYTLKTMYDNDSIGITLDNGTECRIKVGEISKMLNDFIFTTEQKRKHTYLSVEESIYEDGSDGSARFSDSATDLFNKGGQVNE